jgi:hypothetical protein
VSAAVVASDAAPVSPAVRYVARRDRNRRNQVTLAIVLLIAVIVLAIVLIFVLQRGSARPTTGAVQSGLVMNCIGLMVKPRNPAIDSKRKAIGFERHE